MEETAVTQESNEKREGGGERGASKQTCDRLFFWQLYSSVKRIRALFTSYLFLSWMRRMKRPTFSGARERMNPPPLLRSLGSSPAIRGEGRGVIFRDIGAGLRFSSFFLSCFVRLLREAYVIIGGKHWSRKSLAKCLLVVGEWFGGWI